VVDGSNPSTPTIQNRHKTTDYVKPPTNELSTFGNTWQQFGNKFSSDELALLLSLQSSLDLSDTVMAQELGISRAYFSRLKSGQRPTTPAILEKIKEYFQKTGSDGNFNDPFYALHIKRTNNMNAKNPGLEKTVSEFLTARQVEGKTKDTLVFYRDNLNRFIWWVKKEGLPLKASSISPTDIRSFLVYLQTTNNRWGIGSNSSREPASMSTVDAYWRTLHAFYMWLVKEGIINENNNPMRNIPRPKVPQKIIQDIPPELIQQAIDGWNCSTLIHDRNIALIMLLWDTGARLNECYEIFIEHLDLINGTVLLWGKGNKQRISGLGPKTCRVLKIYLKHVPYDKGPLWIIENGSRFSRYGIQTMVRRLKKLGGGVRWSPHTFRTTFAVDFMRNGGDVFSLQTLGGWTDLEMPRHYTQALKVEDALRAHRRASPADMLDIKSD
jgi:site-specific recombinase XerD